MQSNVSEPRRRRTSPRVRVIDAAMKAVVTVGGLGVIAAVLLIMAYLAMTALPLLSSGSAEFKKSHPLAQVLRPHALLVDEYRGLAVVIDMAGSVRATTLTDNAASVVLPTVIPDGKRLTAISPPTEAGVFAMGFDDGSVQIATVSFVSDFAPDNDPPIEGKSLNRGDRAAMKDVPGAYVERTPLDQLRITRVDLTAAAPTDLSEGEGAVVCVDLRASAGSQYLAAIRADGTGVFNRVSVSRPLGGGKPRVRLESEKIAYRAPPGRSGPPDQVFVTADGSHVFCVFLDGIVDRYCRAASGDGFVFAESVRPMGDGVKFTAASMLLGAKTLILADDRGNVAGVFASRQETIGTPDGYRLVTGHRFEQHAGSKGVALAASQRDRTFLSVSADGACVVRNMSSEKQVAAAACPPGSPPVLAAIAPKLNGFATLHADGSLSVFDLAPGYPEASFTSLFGKVWYEGDATPQYVYQSSSGEDSAEVKYSLVPLIFGTLKATFYSMLFAAPLAILAALYSSEMLHPKVRNRVKPAIEMMASLPSVVLGFVAAMVIAPWARDALPGILLAFFVVPAGALLAAYVWQLLPTKHTARLTSGQHLGLVGFVVVASLGLCALTGGVVEKALFSPSKADQLVLAGSVEPLPREQWPDALRERKQTLTQDTLMLRRAGLYQSQGAVVRPVGSVDDPKIAAHIKQERLAEPSIRRWLDGAIGSAFPGWLLVMTPVGITLIVLLRARFLDGFFDRFGRTGAPAAWAQLVRFVLTLAGGVALAAALAAALSGMGMDARDSVLGPFSQRNTLIVGLIMGFAIIPIIYTISEDALSAVPSSLRSASLGCGATRWQTAVRVVLPIAGSGIFSACMIGLGRAAGETMIVVMATGNTPSMDWSLFSGFRTLSANIAVEMPEAVEGYMHYRVLFLGALCLFAMTFIVNTAAEIVRQRFRARSAAL